MDSERNTRSPSGGARSPSGDTYVSPFGEMPPTPSVTVHGIFPLGPWGSGKSTAVRAAEELNKMSFFAHDARRVDTPEMKYAWYRHGKFVRFFVYESPAVVTKFFKRLGYRGYDTTVNRENLANEVWSSYLKDCMFHADLHLFDDGTHVHMWCDFHPLSGTRFRELYLGDELSPAEFLQKTLLEVHDIHLHAISEYAFVPEEYETPVYFAGPVGKRTPETRGHVDIEAPDDVPLRMISNIPREKYVRRII